MNSITTEIRKSANIKEFSNALHEYRTSRGVSTFDSADEFEDFLEACLEKAEYLLSSIGAQVESSPSFSAPDCRRLFLQVFLTQFDFDNLVPNQPFHVMTTLAKLAPKFVDVCFCLMLERARSDDGNENEDDTSVSSEIRGQSHHLLPFMDTMKSSVGFDFNDDPDEGGDDYDNDDEDGSNRRQDQSPSIDALSIFNSALSSSSALAQILADTLESLVEGIKTRNQAVGFVSDALQQLVPLIGEVAFQENVCKFNKMQNFLRVRDLIIQCLDKKVVPNPGSNIYQIAGAIQQLTSTSEGAACWNTAEFADALNQLPLDGHPLSARTRVVQIICNMVCLLKNRSQAQHDPPLFQHFTRHPSISKLILECATAKVPHWDSNDELLTSIGKISLNAEFCRALVSARIQNQSGIEIMVEKLGEDGLSLRTVTRLVGILLNMIKIGTPEDFVDICSRDNEVATILVKNLQRVNDHSNDANDTTIGFSQRTYRKFALAFQVQPIEACGWDKYYHDRVLPSYNLCEIISRLANSCTRMRMEFLRQENFTKEIFNCFATLDLAISSSPFSFQAVIAAEVAYSSIISGEFVAEREQEIEILVEKSKRPQPPESSTLALKKGAEKRYCPFGGVFFVPTVYFGGTTTRSLDIKTSTLQRLVSEISSISSYSFRGKNQEFLNSLKYLQRQAIRINENSSGLEKIIQQFE